MNQQSYYDILNISRKASDAEVKTAYRALVKTHHPDRNPGNRLMAEHRIKALNEAYAQLKTRQGRIDYNRRVRLHAQNDNKHRGSWLSQISEIFWPSHNNSAKR